MGTRFLLFTVMFLLTVMQSRITFGQTEMDIKEILEPKTKSNAFPIPDGGFAFRFDSHTTYIVSKEIYDHEEFKTLYDQFALMASNRERLDSYDKEWPKAGIFEKRPKVSIAIFRIEKADGKMHFSARVQMLFATKGGGTAGTNGRGESWSLSDGKLLLISGERWGDFIVL